MKTQKPWTDENGNLLSEILLKEVSRSWSIETWNEYLESLEVHARAEDEFSVGNLSSLDQMTGRSLADLQPNTDHFSDEFIEEVKQSIEGLPPRERFLMEEELYLGKSQRTIAQEIGVSRSVMRKTKRKAQDRLAKKLSKYPPS